MQNNHENSFFDAIVIGSGIGGLTAASLLSNFYQKKVLLIEKHDKFGGYTHLFTRKNFSWNVGLHYVGGMKKGTPLRNVMDHVTRNKVDWLQLNDPFQHYLFPGMSFAVHSSKTRLILDLKRQFPFETEKIDTYFKDVETAKTIMMSKFFSHSPSNMQASNRQTLPISTQTTTEYFQSRQFSTELAALLDSQWGNYGLPPGKSPFIVHAMMVDHYFDGAYYPSGGSSQIAQSVVNFIRQSGGRALDKHEAVEIIVENNRSIGVTCRSPHDTTLRHFYAPIIISDIGITNTYKKLLSKHQFEFDQDLLNLSDQAATCISLFLGFTEDPRRLGISGENYWIYSDTDHDAMYARNEACLLQGDLQIAFLSFASQNDPKTTFFTGQMIVPGGKKIFEPWRGTSVNRRGLSYSTQKKQLEQRMLSFLEKHFPGINSIIAHAELGTPLTYESYTGHRHGQTYGLPLTFDRFGKYWTQATSPIQGLYLAGADIGGGGISGAMLGGLMALQALYGFEVFKRAFRPPSE